jgi:hypothetical protein
LNDLSILISNEGQQRFREIIDTLFHFTGGTVMIRNYMTLSIRLRSQWLDVIIYIVNFKQINTISIFDTLLVIENIDSTE